MLSAWLSSQELPEEWQRRSSHLIQWRSGDRLANLIAWWRDNRLANDQEIFEAACAWRKQYLHLANWSRNLQDQMVSRIRERYRVFAACVARDYDVVVMETFDIRQVAIIPQPESTAVTTASNTYRQMVSPSTLRTALWSACAREGVRVVEMRAEYTTSTCHACGDSRKWDQAESVIHRCQACGKMWDQDQNAAINLLSAWRASGEEVPSSAA